MKERSTINEQYLLALLKEGDKPAFTRIYNIYSPRIYKNILSMVKDPLIAEELVQEIFCKIWEQRKTIEIRHSAAAYLYRVSRNCVYDFYRKLKSDEGLYKRFLYAATQHFEDGVEKFDRKETYTLLETAVEKLSPQQKKVYRICRLENKTYKEAALQLGISPHTVKEYLVKANQNIREFILCNIDSALPAMLIAICIELKASGI